MITIENSRKYAPISEKLTMAEKITSIDQVIDENGIVNKNLLKILSTCFFVGLYAQDQNITTEHYDEIVSNRIDIDLKCMLDETEVIEWEEILANAVENVVETRKNHTNNVMGAIISLLNTLNKKVENVDLDKMLKQILKAIKNPEAARNVKEIFKAAKMANGQSV